MTTILAASGTAILVLLAGSLPWAGFGPLSGLAAWNLRIGTTMPWAVLPMALYLWGYWRVLTGTWGNRSSAAERRRNLRARPLSAHLWVASLMAGLLGFAAILAALSVMARLVRMPAGVPITTPSQMPVMTAVALLGMQSIVAGVTEEAAFRGFMQSMIERELGVGVAILAQGTLFGLLHFGNHPADVLLMLPYYIGVSAVYGALTWAVDSILPALVLHSAGDLVVLTRWWATGRPEWQVGDVPPALVSDSGVDAPFIVSVAAAVGLSVLTARAYAYLRARRVVGDFSRE